MNSKQVHHQTNRKSLLLVGSVLLIGGASLPLGLNFAFSSGILSMNAISSLPFVAVAALSLAQPLLLLLSLIGIFMLGIATTKIVTSSEGIEFYQAFFGAKSRWSNLERIGSFQLNNVSGQAIFFLRPVKQALVLLPSLPISSINMIPLYQFDFTVGSELRRALELYRPDLLN